MSGKANSRQVRLYAFGNSYIMSSDFVKNEKLQIRITDSGAVCINRISLDEWESMCKGKSMNASTIYTGLGCLGILTLPNELQQQYVGQQPQTGGGGGGGGGSSGGAVNNDTLSYLVFVRDAFPVGTVRTFDMMRINDLYILSLNDPGNFNSYAYSQPTTQSSYQQGVNAATNYYNLNSLNEIKKLLCSGTFYFATSYDPNYSYDITLSCQARYLNQPTNKKFLWNYNMHIPFRRLNIDPNQWLIKIICGYVEIRNVNCATRYIKAALFSRLSNERVGTRFQCRGVNDAGQCANFVETEQVLFTTDPETNCEEEYSFIQLRGSVPVFFEQPGVQVGSHRIKISRSMEACYPAFERHLVSIIHDYGPNIYVLNLLGTKGDENELTGALRVLCENSPFYRKRQLYYFNFDYHNEMKINKGAKSKVWGKLTSGFYDESFNGAFFYTRIPPGSGGTNGGDNDSGFDSSSMGGGAFSPPLSNNNNNGGGGQPSPEQQSVTQLQRNFVRTNCMDCLDRTNSVQSYLAAEEMVWHQLKNLVRESEYRRFRDIFLSMWVLSGDHISKIYAGTGAIQGRSVTQDFTRSLGRALQNNLFDDNKNDSIETYLNAPHSTSLRKYGELEDFVYNLTSKAFLRLPFSIVRELIYKKREYTDVHKCRLVVGTWNVNGGFSDGDMKRVNLAEWLLDGPMNAKRSGMGYLDTWLREANLNTTDLGEIDMFVIGFEEIVDLSAQNIINASEENATIWRRKITEFLSKYGDYVELIYENLQLVGVCLFVFVLRKHVAAIRDVSVAKTKTGLGGAAGNKGGVLLRFVYYNTSLCFVCAHFAAHQKQVKERNDDFRQIYEQSQFVGGSRLKLTPRNHDYVFWCGDLNYRIDMPNDRCRSLIGERCWDELLELDQLTVQRKEKNVFKEFYEAPISFPPTYKYNVLEDTYDRSEKCRVPAWTDRILWRKRHDLVDKKADVGRCLYYGRSDIRYSDHRPVSGLFEIETDKVDPSRLVDTLHKSFQSTHGSFQVVLVVTTHTNCMNEIVRNAIIKLFACFPSYCFAREYRGSVYVVFSDGKHGYEAFAQLNNYNLESFDLQLQIRVENETNFTFLFEEEIRDCLNSLSYYDNNLRKLAISSLTPAASEVKVGDLLGDDTYTSEAFLNVPSQLHTDLSHVARLSSSSPSDFGESGGSLAEPKNPLVKALSNSNLASMFGAPTSTSLAHQQHKFVHSEVNLLDLNVSAGQNGGGGGTAAAAAESAHLHLMHQHSNQGHRPPPKRPPPPTAAQLAVKEDKLIDISGDEADENQDSKSGAADDLQVFEQQVSNDSAGGVSFGFEDDFSKMATHDLVFAVPPPTAAASAASIPRPPSIQIANRQHQQSPPPPPPQHQSSPPPIPPLPPVTTATTTSRAAPPPFVPARPVPAPPQPPPLPVHPPAVAAAAPLPASSNTQVKPNLLFQLLDDSSSYETATTTMTTAPPPLPPPPPIPSKPLSYAASQQHQQQPIRPPPLPPMPSSGARPRPPTPPTSYKSTNHALLEELFDSTTTTTNSRSNNPPPLPPPPPPAASTSNMPRIPPRPAPQPHNNPPPPQHIVDPFAPMTANNTHPPAIPPHPKTTKQQSPFDSDFDPFAPLPPPRENHFK